MGEVAITIFKITARITFISALVFAFTTFIVIAINALAIGVNATILNEIYGIVQIWLPFNLSAVLIWVITASSAYLLYKLAFKAIRFLNLLISR